MPVVVTWAAVVTGTTERQFEQVSALVAAGALLGALLLHLIPAFFAGMLVYFLVHSLAPLLGRHIEGRRSRIWATGLLAVVVVLLLALGMAGLLALANGPHNGLEPLWERLMASLNSGEAFLPVWVTSQFPVNSAELKEVVMRWLHVHSPELSLLGKETGVTLAQSLIAMVIGGMLATQHIELHPHNRPMGRALLLRASRFQESFADVVGAQFKIALINAGLTTLYLVVLLPLAGVHLPLVKTLVLLTLIMGMVPVLGNVLSNTLIVLVSLSVSV